MWQTKNALPRRRLRRRSQSSPKTRRKSAIRWRAKVGKQKKGARPNHKPRRTCLGCREVDWQQALVRLAALPEGVVVDPTGKLGGRGAYLHPRRQCLQRFVRTKINRFQSLRRSLDRSERVNLVNMVAGLLAPNSGLL